MGNSYGASKFPSSFTNCVLRAPLCHSAGYTNDIDEFPIIPSGVTVTNNGTWTKSDLGNNKSVLVFDGSTNYISLTDNDAWNIYDGDFTVCGWIKFSDITAFRGILGQYVDSSNGAYIYWNHTLSQLALTGISGGVSNFGYNCPMSVSAGTWYHFVIQRSGSSCLMYVDGVSKTVSTDVAFTNTTNIAAPLTIGKVLSGTYHAGNIYDLRIYNGRALTLPEIKLIMAKTHPVTGTGMIAGPYNYWRLTA